MGKLCAYHWPGNVRELENVLGRTIVQGREVLDELIEASSDKHERLPAIETPGGEIAQEQADPNYLVWRTPFPPNQSLESAVEEFKIAMIQDALRRTGGDKSKAARLLRTSRNVFYRPKKSSGQPVPQ